MADERLDRWLRPRVVISVVSVVLLLALLLGRPQEDAPRLSSHSTAPSGAGGFFAVAERLGWSVTRRETMLRGRLDSATVYATLLPPMEVSERETGLLLDAVRRGAGLIAVLEDETALSDSLRIGVANYFLSLAAADTTRMRRTAEQDRAMRAALLAITYSYLIPVAPLPRDTVTFLAGQAPDRAFPIVVGLPLGRGRIVAVAEPALLTNEVVRAGHAAVLMMRALDWAARGSHTPIVVDEYHHGYGPRPHVTRAVRRALFDTPAGRVALQLLAAGLVLIVALAIRPVPAAPRTVVARRSPLEHVGALARAYEQIGATGLTARRLTVGLQRRHAVGAAAQEEASAFLERVRTRHPSVASDVDRLRAAAATALPPTELSELAGAVERIERVVAHG